MPHAPRRAARRATPRAAFSASPERVRAELPAQLNYSTRHDRGYRRERRGQGFVYLRPDGRRLGAEPELRRIRRLAIPPAWTQVWICADPHGHLQAAGRDARGRWQYRYHPDLREVRDETKYERLVEFARALPLIRRRVARDLRAPPLSRTAVLATVVNLLERTLIRVGNSEYARTNRSYGLTTIRDRHVAVRRDRVRFHFRGKSGQWHDVELRDRRLAPLVRRLQHLPGQDLFQYRDEQGRVRDITSADVNAYLREAAGTDVTAKDFRTWAGTVAAAGLLGDPSVARAPRTKRRVREAVAKVARQLGNTPAVCRRCYIHPGIIADYLAGKSPRVPPGSWSPRRGTGLSRPERAVLRRLRALRPSRPAVRNS